MLSIFQFNETSPTTVAGASASSHAVTGSDPSATAGILSSCGLEEALGLLIVGELVGATGGTLDVYVQTFYLGVWYDYLHFPQLSDGAGATKCAYVGGPGYSANSTAIGVGSSPALAADTIVGGAWGEKMRLWMVPGATTTVGAAVKITLSAQLPRQWSR